VAELQLVARGRACGRARSGVACRVVGSAFTEVYVMASHACEAFGEDGIEVTQEGAMDSEARRRRLGQRRANRHTDAAHRVPLRRANVRASVRVVQLEAPLGIVGDLSRRAEGTVSTRTQGTHGAPTARLTSGSEPRATEPSANGAVGAAGSMRPIWVP
jgi:hypothetical protein